MKVKDFLSKYESKDTLSIYDEKHAEVYYWYGNMEKQKTLYNDIADRKIDIITTNEFTNRIEIFIK